MTLYQKVVGFFVNTLYMLQYYAVCLMLHSVFYIHCVQKKLPKSDA